MPNWLYLVFNFVYHLGLALWIGGAVALGALAAPALFGALPRQQAGAIFGPTLRRFTRLRVGALVLVVIGAGAKYLMWESHTATPWIAVRWASIAVLAGSVLYEVLGLEQRMELLRRDLRPDVPEDDPRRQAFNVLHRRAEGLMKASLAAAAVALFFS